MDMEMKELVAAFPEQLKKAKQIAAAAQLKDVTHPIDRILISGLGGSGIGGSIVAEMVEQKSLVPIHVTKDYFCPAFVNQNTLAIICSYSGDTEETIQVLHEAAAKNPQVVVITSGGKAKEWAEKNGAGLIIIPGGMPPRSCIGYSMVQILFVLDHYGIAKMNYADAIEKSIVHLKSNLENIQAEAKRIAEIIYKQTPVIYTSGPNEGIAIRFRQQLNENGKLLCWHHVLPEMNHNELVAWVSPQPQLAVLFFRFQDEYPRTTHRIEFCKKIISKFCPNIIEMHAKGESVIERSLHLIHLGDWISCYVADLKKVDAMDISVIADLKKELSEV
jgi:glucose/mannose-6-phosphate isomerase